MRAKNQTQQNYFFATCDVNEYWCNYFLILPEQSCHGSVSPVMTNYWVSPQHGSPLEGGDVVVAPGGSLHGSDDPPVEKRESGEWQ